MDVMNNYVQHLTFPGTSLRFHATTHSGKSISGSETPYQAQTEFEILPGRNVIFAAPRLIANADNESLQSNNKGYSLRCAFSTTSTNVSPILDLNRSSVVTVQNRINNGSYSIYSNIIRIINRYPNIFFWRLGIWINNWCFVMDYWRYNFFNWSWMDFKTSWR